LIKFIRAEVAQVFNLNPNPRIRIPSSLKLGHLKILGAERLHRLFAFEFTTQKQNVYHSIPYYSKVV